MNLEAEVRNDYLISPEVKRLWAVQMDILAKFDEICKKHDIPYFVEGGTLLGAARHKGYIPWDDDIDVQMLAEDYEKFCKYAKDELKEPYFLQFWDTEYGFYPWNAKIRKSDTTCYSDWELEMNRDGNHGIFIDVILLYNIPDNKIKRKFQTLRLKYLAFLFKSFECSRALENPYAKRTSKRKLAGAFWKVCSVFTNVEKVCKSYLRVCASEKKETKYIGYNAFLPGDKRYVWERRFFEKTVMLPFEDIMVPAPVMYDEKLQVEYGEWNKPVKGGACHSTLRFSDAIPYKEYVKNK